MREMGLRVDVFLLALAVVWSPVVSDLVMSKVDRRVSLVSLPPFSAIQSYSIPRIPDSMNWIVFLMFA